MAKVNVLIAEDEAPARNKMVRLLQDFEDVSIINVSTNGMDAYENILKYSPDVVFLDIEMPGMNGLDVVKTLPPEHSPVVVFVTAYNEHAIVAFELNAVDYLLKPFNKQRLEQTIERIHKQLGEDSSEENRSNVDKVVQQLSSATLNKIPIPTADRYKLLSYHEVMSIEVEDRMTHIYTTEKAYPINQTLDHFEKKLPGDHFFRVSRSAIINLHAVKEIVLWFGNRYKIVLNNKREVISSREKSKMLKHILKV